MGGVNRRGRVDCWSTALRWTLCKARAARDSRLTVDSTPSVRPATITPPQSPGRYRPVVTTPRHHPVEAPIAVGVVL
ncbi:hypothetical protein D7Y40_06845 [Stenotrophomonas maltophilia]|nr:hypothetical protein [Stenotrophomonas maltophilia]MBA0542082.1 hypothetical protein [Stenotrophomonas maltophilia]REC80983.1 hypothetical protein DXK52_19735 [Stenotrophomonas maltophilia]